MRASVVGLGQLGAPLVAVLAKSGLEVCGIDLNPDKVEKLASGIAPVREPRLQQLMTAHRARIRATSDWRTAIAEADVTFVLVPTPSGVDGAFKNDHLLAAIEEIARVIKTKSEYHLVVVGSTVMPGTVGGPIRQRLETVSGKRVGRDIGLCYNPEFIALGNVVAGLLRPDFVVIGESDERAGAILAAIWRRMAGDRVPISRMNFINAELTKLAVNTYVTGKISFANMLGEICDNLVDADVDVVTATIGRDTRIGGKYLRGATGYGGPCFPRDTLAFTTMARQAGVEANLAAAAQAINDRQLDRVREIVLARTGAADRIAVLGLAYKPDTAVIEHAQGVMLAAALDKLGRRVVVHDPLALAAARAALGPGVSFAASAAAAVATAEAVAVMLPCAEYQAFFAAWSGAGPTRLVVDCWRLVDAAFRARTGCTSCSSAATPASSRRRAQRSPAPPIEPDAPIVRHRHHRPCPAVPGLCADGHMGAGRRRPSGHQLRRLCQAAVASGQAGYLDTIRYIDDGVRYLDPYAVFLVSPAGELCFRGAMEIGIRKLPNYYDYWCMTPAAVAEVDALDNDVSYIPEVQLWCRHASPYCARRVQYQEYQLSPGLGFSNTITVPVIPFKQEKGAIEHLVYLMGGDVHDPYGLDTRHVGDSVPPLTR